MIGEATHLRKVCRRQFRAGPSVRAFTVLEIIIVVLAIGILATLVIPQFTRANQQSKVNALKDVLQYLRTQVAVFKAQHQEVPPGYPQGDPDNAPTVDAFMEQLSEHSDVMCRLSSAESPSYIYGPYMTQLPVNPINGLNTIEVIPNNQPIPTRDGKTGWIYKPQTQEVIANIVGTDGSQTPYSNY